MLSNKLVGDWKSEEQYVLRVRDPALAERIRNVLREDAEEHKKLDIRFTSTTRCCIEFANKAIHHAFTSPHVS